MTEGPGSRNLWWRDVGTFQRVGGQRRFRYRWAIIAIGFLTPYAAPSVRIVLEGHRGLWWNGLVLALVAVYSLCYLLFPMVLPVDDLRRRLVFCVGMLAVGWAQLALLGPDSLSLMTYVMAMLAFVLPVGWVLVLDGASAAGLAVLLLVTGRWSEDVGDLITICSVSFALLVMGRLIRTVRVLRRAQDEIATLAVTAERERVARDLHDILGHSLTTITVKAGLARRVLESSKDVDSAITEIREVEGLSRSALGDVRATVSEYLEVSLPAEIAGARAALRAAEIDADLPHAVDDVRPDLQRVFGYVLREAVTNVIRHSDARTVRARLGRNWLEIEDDGTAAGEVRQGNGLRGLSERLAEVGGTVTARPKPGGGFVLRAEAPEHDEPAAAPATAQVRPVGEPA
nr:sensor histidine kinase [Amycolatopsis nigrescens]